MKLMISALLISLISVIALAGCNTVKGFGQDMQRGGQEVEHAAQS